MSDAKFKARNLTTSGAWSLFADAGFDASPGDVIQVQLEDTPASDIWQTVFACILRSDGRSLPVFTPSTGIAATPTAAATFVMPAGERGTWSIQCQTNGGEPVLVNGAPDYTVNTKVRFFAARTSPLSLRHPLDDETTQYTPHGPSVALQELIDAVVAAVGAASGANVNGHYIEDATTALNVHGIALRALAAALGFKGTDVAPATWERASPQASASVALGEWFRSVSNASGFGATGTAFTWPMYLPDGAGTKTEAARFTVGWSAIVGPVATFGLDVATNPGGGGLLRAITFTGGGAIRLHGAAYAHAGYRLVLDGSGNLSASLITFTEVNAALATADASIAVNGQKITALGTPTADTDAATKGYADALAQGLDVKASVLAATTANITLSGAQTIDTVSVTAGKRVLVKDQSTGSQNGLYLCAAGAWTRTADLAAGASAAGIFTFIEEGSQADQGWVCTSNAGSDVVGSDSLAFTQFSSIAVVAGDGLVKTGNTINVVVNADGGLIVTANEMQLGALGAARVLTALAAAAGSIAVNSQKITSLADGSSAQDAAAFGQIATAVNAAVNGTTNTIQKATGAHTLGDSGITDDGTTVATSRVVVVTKSGIAAVKTFAVVIGNDTVSATQVSGELAFYAFHSGGTRHNTAFQEEPQSATRKKWIGYYGTGTSPPTSTGFVLDTNDPNFGLSLQCGTFVASTSGNGFRLVNNGGGMKEDGSANAIFQNAAAGSNWRGTSSTSTGNSGSRFSMYADAGTPSAGSLLDVGYGSTSVFKVSSATATMGHLLVNGVDHGWSVRTVAFADSPVTAAIGDRFLVDTTGGIVTINLPAVPSVTSARQLDIIVIDAKLNFTVNRCIIAPNGTNKIDTVNASVTLVVTGVGKTLVHDGDSSNWWSV